MGNVLTVLQVPQSVDVELAAFLSDLQVRINVLLSKPNNPPLSKLPLRASTGDIAYFATVDGYLEGLYVLKTTGWAFIS